MRQDVYVSARVLKHLARLTPTARHMTPKNEDICGVVSHRGWLCATNQYVFARIDIGMRPEGTHIISKADVDALPADAMLTCDYEGWRDEEGKRYGRSLWGDWVDFPKLLKAMEGEDAGYGVSPSYMTRVMQLCADLDINPVIKRGAHGHVIEGRSKEGALQAIVMGVAL